MLSASPVAGRPVDLLTWTGRHVRRNVAAAARFGRWALDPAAYPPAVRGVGVGRFHERRVPLGGDGDPALEAGKRTNVERIAALIDGVALSPDRPFSFARVVGPLTLDRGFVAGRALLGGCLVPSVGGGACLVSNALFAAAVELGWTILERHGHSLQHPDVRLPELDATVRYPDVDLRFAPDRPVVLRAAVEGEHFVLRVQAAGAPPSVAIRRVDIRELVEGGQPFHVERVVRSVDDGPWAEVATNRRRIIAAEKRHRNCWTCGETTCWERKASLGVR